MDQDFFIEETSPLKIIFYVILFLGLIGGSVYFYIDYKNSSHVKLKNVTVELGTKLPKDKETYIETNNKDAYSLDLSTISTDENGNVNMTGEYSFKVRGNGETKKGKVYVKDTTKPVIELEDLTVGVNESFSPNDYLTKCEDLSLPCTAKFQNAKDLEINTKEGTYSIKLIVSDAAGNEVTKDVKLIVSGESTLAKKKASDLTFSYLVDNDEEWNKSYTLKLDKAIAEDSVDYNDYINDLSTREYSFTKKVSEKKILTAYNKYNYVIGFSIKITFEDNSVLYITKDNAEEITDEN